ncbi:MAG: YggT family protein [Acetobacteraceae bacterium]|nr:YggT family protein [Acetobacteraceae bacterium]
MWYVLALAEALLLLRFILKLLGANPNAAFTQFVYQLTNILVAPFAAVFKTTAVSGSVFEWTTLLALGVYYAIAWGIIELLAMSRSVSTPEAAQKLKRESSI